MSEPSSILTPGKRSRPLIPMCQRLFKNSRNSTDSDCRNWTRSINNSGYGIVGVGQNKNTVAHRVAYAVFRGPIPAGAFVLHKCDNRRCVNPDHLFLGTQSDNMRDCAKKGRLKLRFGLHFGEKHNWAKLTDLQIAEIRTLLAQGNLTQRAIGKRFGVTDSHICQIGSGKRRAR